jgi:hypothetical protein
MTFDEFTQEAHALGYQETLSRSWDPLTVLATHTHPFDARALVTAGEMWLTVDGQTQHLLVGDRFALTRETPHDERYGAQGATYWVARRT